MSDAINYANKPWLGYYDQGVPKSIEFENVCLPEYLERSARKFPNNWTLTFQGYHLTYRQLKDLVDRMATCLTDLGIKKGDRVAIVLPNMIPCVAAYYAVIKLGAIVVMNNPMYSAKELEHQFSAHSLAMKSNGSSAAAPGRGPALATRHSPCSRDGSNQQ
jgi:long-chain acyl-CoA synthetase